MRLRCSTLFGPMLGPTCNIWRLPVGGGHDLRGLVVSSMFKYISIINNTKLTNIYAIYLPK